ncbi:tRNA guanosine(34) transglycosylase Tgt [Micavibrio aeruginosavorus]|uniref:Queuine tRNA-ribosyltransferase n=1 Tax=Micavibrio aeruginosavorus EPB TaxID=349215 RepID=M4VF46_9BACT|nr:tRNA guanosine(34) transglycosylase Tgt [Micavibrio aeruginosavorus]AGH97848.1 tRNA-guanine transglycosylase [Micavibrio aeruginosavorus EPB]
MLTYPNFAFDVLHRDQNGTRARIGRLVTPHGTIETPNYIFCGTKGAIKNLSPMQMREAGADIILGNTYHLMIQPGADLIERMGGLHEFNRWDGPMMTDSGGFQIFSMGHGGVADEIKGRSNNKGRGKSLLEISEEGARFKSYWDGSILNLTPEESISIQRKVGADLIYQFDECTAYHVERSYTEESMYRSHRWGERSIAEFERGHDGRQALYGIVQGGVYKDLRDISCEWTAEKPFFGTAIGGCLGGSTEEFYEITGWCVEKIHPDRPVHLLGIGAIRDIFTCVRLGIDTFDCVSPTRIARHGWALTKGGSGRMNLRNAQYREDKEPLDASLGIPASAHFSRAYIHHLLKAGELLASQLIAQHNVAVMTRLMREIRAAIKNGTLDSLEREWIED